MSRKGLFGIVIAFLISGIIILAIELSLSFWQIALGFILSWGLTLGYANLRNAFGLFFMTLVLLVSGYLSTKYSWFGVLPGAVIGCAAGILMHFGWIVSHKPFSRSEYIKSQEPGRVERRS